MENITKHGNIKLVTTNRRRSHLVAEPNYHTTNWFSENPLAKEEKSKNEQTGLFRSINSRH